MPSLFQSKSVPPKVIKQPVIKETKKDNGQPKFITPKQFKEDEMELACLIQQRRLQLLVHSRVYYKLDSNVISDKKWDKWAYELVELQKNYPAIANQICYAKEFQDWDGTTGAFLPLDEPWVVQKVTQLYGNLKKEGQKNVSQDIKNEKRAFTKGKNAETTKKVTTSKGLF